MEYNPSDKVTIQFTITKKDRELISQHANRARLTVSQYCKMSVFSRINNYPLKKSKVPVIQRK